MALPKGLEGHPFRITTPETAGESLILHFNSLFDEQRHAKTETNRIKFLRKTARCISLIPKRNKEILEESGVLVCRKQIHKYKYSCLTHVSWFENSSIPKLIVYYKPREYRRPGRLLRELLDGAETVPQIGLICD